MNKQLSGARAWSETVFLILLLFLSPVLAAQDDAISENPDKTSHSSPRKTVSRLLDAMSSGSVEQLAMYFDTRPTSELRGIDTQLVISTFPSLLDQYGSLLPSGILSNDEEGEEEDGLAPDFERFGKIVVGDDVTELLLERIDLNNQETKWLVSQQTLVDLAAISADTTVPLIERILPTILNEMAWRGIPVGHWLSIPFIAILSFLTGRLVAFLLQLSISFFTKERTEAKMVHILLAMVIPVWMVSSVFIFLWAERFLGISIVLRQSFSVVTISVLWIAIFVFLWSLLDRMSSNAELILRKKNKVAGLSFIIFFRAAAKVLIIFLAVIAVLSSNGVNVTAGLAALGIGGIALALGAQKAIENTLGSLIIVLDQPFRVGDFCKIEDTLGTIERIGLRSTQIRTLADTLVTYPNGALSSEKIENYTLRSKFLLNTVFNLRYETDQKQLNDILAQMRKALKTTPSIAPQGQRVHFTEYGACSLNIEVFAYLYAPDYEVFLEKQEAVLLTLGRIVETNNCGFAFPSQTLYFVKDNNGKAKTQNTKS